MPAIAKAMRRIVSSLRFIPNLREQAHRQLRLSLPASLATIGKMPEVHARITRPNHPYLLSAGSAVSVYSRKSSQTAEDLLLSNCGVSREL
jgi:hypothetical protein